jgi:MFS family permease
MSAVGDTLVEIALIFAILHIGGTVATVGIVVAIQTLSKVAFLLIGGVWADRLRRQDVMIAADITRAIIQATLAFLLITGRAKVWELGAGALIYGITTSFFDPASTSLIPETVPAEQLQQAYSAQQLPLSFFAIGGPLWAAF